MLLATIVEMHVFVFLLVSPSTPHTRSLSILSRQIIQRLTPFRRPFILQNCFGYVVWTGVALPWCLMAVCVDIMWPFTGYLAASWGQLGKFRGHPEAILGRLGAISGHVRTILGHFGAILGHLGAS